MSAAALASNSLRVLSDAGDKEGMAASLITLGANDFLAGELGAAEPYLVQGLNVAVDVGHRELIATALEALGGRGAPRCSRAWSAPVWRCGPSKGGHHSGSRSCRAAHEGKCEGGNTPCADTS